MTEESPKAAGVTEKQRCPICLEDFDDKTFIDPCFHCFCFLCIVQWSEVTTTCPMCKTTFSTLIHNVEANDKYTQFKVEQKEKLSSQEVSLGEARRFRYRTTRVPGQSRVPHQGTSQRESGREEFEEERTRERQRRERQERRRVASQQLSNPASDERRRVIYSLGLWAQSPSTGGRKERLREISAVFFKRNPACTHRLIPWLAREFRVVLGAEHVQFMIQLVLSLISKIDLEGDEFSKHLQPFLLTRTTHFLHEFISFARSPFNTSAYDNSVRYDWPNGDGWDPEATVSAVTEQLQHTPRPGPSGLSTEEIQERLFYELTATRWDDSPPFLHLPSSPILVHGSDSESDLQGESVGRPHNTTATSTDEVEANDSSSSTATAESRTAGENISHSDIISAEFTMEQTTSTTSSTPLNTTITSAGISITAGNTDEGVGLTRSAERVDEHNTPDETAEEEDDEGGKEREEGGGSRHTSGDEREDKSSGKGCDRSQETGASGSDLPQCTDPPAGEGETCIVINAEGEIEEQTQAVSSAAAVCGSLTHRQKGKRPAEKISSQSKGKGVPISQCMDHRSWDITHKSSRRNTRERGEERGKDRKGKERSRHSHKKHKHSSESHTRRHSEHKYDDEHQTERYRDYKSRNYSSSDSSSDTDLYHDSSSSDRRRRRRRDRKRREVDISTDRYYVRDKGHRSRLYSDDYATSSSHNKCGGSTRKKRAAREPESPQGITSSTINKSSSRDATVHTARQGRRRKHEGATLRKELSSLDKEIVKQKREVLKAMLRSERIKLLHRQLQGEDLPDDCNDELDCMRKPLVITEATPTGEVEQQLADLDRAIVDGKRKALRVMKKLEERATGSDVDSS